MWAFLTAGIQSLHGAVLWDALGQTARTGVLRLDGPKQGSQEEAFWCKCSSELSCRPQVAVRTTPHSSMAPLWDRLGEPTAYQVPTPAGTLINMTVVTYNGNSTTGQACMHATQIYMGFSSRPQCTSCIPGLWAHLSPLLQDPSFCRVL